MIGARTLTSQCVSRQLVLMFDYQGESGCVAIQGLQQTFAGMRAIVDSSPKTKHAPVSVRTNAPECPLNVYQELEAMATGASLPDVTLTGVEDELTTTRSESLSEAAPSLQGFACESGKVVGLQRAPISLPNPG